MVKEKGSGGKTKKNAIKSEWDENDTSITQNAVLVGKKKKSVNTMKAFEAATKTVADGKIKKKMAKKNTKKPSDVDDFGASLDKLKEIDPEFYKVMSASSTFFALSMNDVERIL